MSCIRRCFFFLKQSKFKPGYILELPLLGCADLLSEHHTRWGLWYIYIYSYYRTRSSSDARNGSIDIFLLFVRPFI